MRLSPIERCFSVDCHNSTTKPSPKQPSHRTKLHTTINPNHARLHLSMQTRRHFTIPPRPIFIHHRIRWCRLCCNRVWRCGFRNSRGEVDICPRLGPIMRRIRRWGSGEECELGGRGRNGGHRWHWRGCARCREGKCRPSQHAGRMVGGGHQRGRRGSDCRRLLSRMQVTIPTPRVPDRAGTRISVVLCPGVSELICEDWLFQCWMWSSVQRIWLC